VALFVKLFSRVWSTTSASSNCLVRSSMPGAVFSSARRLLFLYGCEDKLRYRLRSVLLPLFPSHTRRIYRKLARRTAAEIEDYQKAALPS